MKTFKFQTGEAFMLLITFVVFGVVVLVIIGVFLEFNQDYESITSVPAAVVSYVPKSSRLEKVGAFTVKRETPAVLTLRLEDGKLYATNFAIRADACKPGASAQAALRIRGITHKGWYVVNATCLEDGK